MTNKKAMGFALEWVAKFIIAIIILVVLISVAGGMFGRVKTAGLNLIDRQYKDFDYIGGTFVNPSLPDDLKEFWFNGFSNFVNESTKSEAPCLGSFYIDDRINMRDSIIRLLQTPTGIEMMLQDNAHVAGVFDNQTFSNELTGRNWTLCVIEPETDFNSMFNSFEASFNSNRPINTEGRITPVNDIAINFAGKPKDGEIKAKYFTKEQLNKIGAAPEEFSYQAYPLKGTAANHRTFFKSFKSKYDRYLFFFVISGDNFCVLPAKFKSKNDGFDLEKLQELLKNRVKSDLKDSSILYVDGNNAFCSLPGGKDSSEKVIFNGYNSCYYYGCDDIDKDMCNQVFEKCKGLCKGRYSCSSCQELNECDDYKNSECDKDMCALSCQWDKIEKECVSK